jgi:hypothetical protein
MANRQPINKAVIFLNQRSEHKHTSIRMLHKRKIDNALVEVRIYDSKWAYRDSSNQATKHIVWVESAVGTSPANQELTLPTARISLWQLYLTVRDLL